MEATNRFFSGFGATRARLAMLAATFVAAMVGVVTPAQASLQNPLTVSAQSGTLTSGTAGSATYTVTVNRNFGSPATPTMAVTGLPAGASPAFGTPSAWTGNFLSESRTYPLTITTTAAVAAGATTFTVQASATGSTPRSGAGTLTVNPAVLAQPQTITFGALAGKTFGDGPFNVSATASSGLTVSFAAAGNCSVAGTLVSVTGAGSCTITASQAGNASWLAATPVAQTFPIAKANQTITFNALADKLVGDPAFTVYATSTSTLAVTFGATGDCTVAGSTVSLTTPATLPGSCTITASQAGNTNFNAAASVPRTFAINAFTGTELYAVAGSTGLPVPGSTTPMSVPVWGYNSSAAAVSKPGGPTLFVDQGATVTIRLHNNLAETTALLIQGQTMIPDTTGVAPGQTKIYTFTASQPGTFLYEAGLLPRAQHQVAMGLYGALVVRPPTSAPLRAYADTSTEFDDEAVLVLGEIDPILNFGPTTFDMRDFKPTHFLINGDVYPNTAPISSAPGRKVLLRYVNGGAKHHSMAALGVRQVVVGEDGSALAHARTVVAKTIAPGQTADAVVTVPAAAQPGSRFAVYDGNLMLHNGGADNAFGGMLTFISVPGTPTGDTTGPVASGLAYAAGTLTATVSDATTGNGNVTAAQYRLDSNPAVAMTGPFGTPTVAVSASLTVPPGAHTLYVRGQDAAGNWGAFATLAVNGGDASGPTTSALVLAPNPSNGTASVALSATASDVASGGSAIASAQYTIGGVLPPIAMTVATTTPVSSITATIPAATVLALSEGTHVVSVTSTDAAGNTGAAATINLIVDKTGPAASNVSATPNPNNGTLPVNQGVQAVRVTATLADTLSNVVAAEGFIDTVGANGSGFPLLPSDGVFNSGTENVFADIPLSTIAALSNGNHSIHVRGRDAAGNWAATTGSVILVIDKVAPTIGSATLAPATLAFGAASTTLSVAANGTGTAIAGGQYWIDGSATPPASPTAFSGTSATINTSALAAGRHTVYVRVQDAATNWSAVSSATLDVVQAVNDARTIAANGTASQNSDANTAAGVLANDQPLGVTGRTATLTTALVRTGGTGGGTLTLSCPGSLGTAATPSVSGQTICTNGAYRVTLNGVGNNNNQRAASKRGTFQFTYTETLNGVTSTATVTITVN